MALELISTFGVGFLFGISCIILLEYRIEKFMESFDKKYANLVEFLHRLEK